MLSSLGVAPNFRQVKHTHGEIFIYYVTFCSFLPRLLVMKNTRQSVCFVLSLNVSTGLGVIWNRSIIIVISVMKRVNEFVGEGSILNNRRFDTMCEW